jgi:hypothetical protein
MHHAKPRASVLPERSSPCVIANRGVRRRRMVPTGVLTDRCVVCTDEAKVSLGVVPTTQWYCQ